jgi:hypothetical protein
MPPRRSVRWPSRGMMGWVHADMDGQGRTTSLTLQGLPMVSDNEQVPDSCPQRSKSCCLVAHDLLEQPRLV